MAEEVEATRGGIFITVLIVSFVDQLGRDFLASVSVSYGLILIDDEFWVALSNGFLGFTLIFASIWMAMLSDRVGERPVICISLFGSMTAYACQALGWNFRGMGNAGFWFFFAGKGLEGFFGGTGATLMSLLARWYLEPAELKQKVAVLQAFSSLIGMFLAPVAGLLTTISMAAPFHVASGMCLLGLIFGLWALPRAGPPSASDADDPDGLAQEVQTRQESRESKKNLCGDKVIIMAIIANFGFGIMIMGMGFMENLLILRNPSFGVADPNDSPLEQKRAVAQMVTLIVMPLGLVSTFVAVVIFPRLSMMWGDALSICVFGSLLSVVLILEALSTQLWQVFAVSALQGVGLGILLPCLGPLLAIYATSIYPNQVSECIALPNVGIAIGLAVGSNVVQGVDFFFESPTIDGERAGFIFIGIVGFVSSSCMALVGRWVAAAVEEKQLKLSKLEKTAFLENGGQNPNDFIETAVEQVGAHLKDKIRLLQNQPIQDLVLFNLLNSVPDLPRWNDATQGRAYLEALHKDLQRAGLKKHDDMIQARFLIPMGVATGRLNFDDFLGRNTSDANSESGQRVLGTASVQMRAVNRDAATGALLES